MRTATSLSSAEAQHSNAVYVETAHSTSELGVLSKSNGLVDYVTNQKEGRKAASKIGLLTQATMPYHYSLLPTHNNGSDHPRKQKKLATNFIANVFLSRRYARFTLFAVFLLACFAFVVSHTQTRLWPASSDSWSHSLTMNWSEYPIPQESPPIYDTRPPLYQRYTAYEDRLPQHNVSLPFPDDSSRKYVFFADHTWGVGWGNVMQEMILNAQLAYDSSRV